MILGPYPYNLFLVKLIIFYLVIFFRKIIYLMILFRNVMTYFN